MKSCVYVLLFLLVMPISSMSAKAEGMAKVKYFKKPLREYSIILTNEGYYPNRIMAYAGEKVRFFVTSTKKQSECFVMQDHKIFLSAKMGEISEGEVVFKDVGKYKFYCPSSKHKGYITVIDKASDVEEQQRKIASDDSKPSYWTPRDYDE